MISDGINSILEIAILSLIHLKCSCFPDDIMKETFMTRKFLQSL